MKRIYLLGFCFALVITACKKEEKETETPAPTAAKQSDQSGSSAADGGVEDVNNYVSNKIGGGENKRMAAYDLPCGVISVDSAIVNGNKVYTFRYGRQERCGSRYKSGNISFHLVQGASFNEAGAINSITFENYKVESNATGDVVTLNGTIYTTNVSGGHIWQAIVYGDTIIHKVRGSFTTLYGNGESRPKSYYQLRTWTSNSGWAGLTFRVAGDTLINGIKVSETGKTYDGNHDYETQMTEDFMWSNCGSSFIGPFLLKNGTARLNATVAGISPVYFQVEAGYKFINTATTPEKTNNCSSNAFKITTVIGATTRTEYQLY